MLTVIGDELLQVSSEAHLESPPIRPRVAFDSTGSPAPACQAEGGTHRATLPPMKLKMLLRLQGCLVTITPPPLGFPADDDWRVKWINPERKEVEIVNQRTNDCPTLGADQIHSFTNDPTRAADGEKHGSLLLLVRLTRTKRSFRAQPLTPAHRARYLGAHLRQRA